MLPIQYAELLISYSPDITVRVKQEETYTEFKQIKQGVPQSSIISPIL